MSLCRGVGLALSVMALSCSDPTGPITINGSYRLTGCISATPASPSCTYNLPFPATDSISYMGGAFVLHSDSTYSVSLKWSVFRSGNWGPSNTSLDSGLAYAGAPVDSVTNVILNPTFPTPGNASVIAIV